MGRRILAVTIAAALFGVVAVPAVAQNSASSAAAPLKSKPGPRTSGGGTVTVKVINWRNADLVELKAVESGSANWKKVLGPLKGGQWTWAKVPQRKNCHVDLRGKYTDGKSADVSNFDICSDKTVDLVNRRARSVICGGDHSSYRFLNLTPGCSPFVNSTPADSRAA